MQLPSNLNALIDAFHESGLGSMELERDGIAVTFSRGATSGAAANPAHVAAPAPASHVAPAAGVAPAAPAAAAGVAVSPAPAAAPAAPGANPVCGPTTCDFTGHTIVSPVVGRVLADAGSVRFPKVGDSVTAGEPLLAVEILKAASEVTATQSGTVAQLHVSPGDVVEWGQPLVTITLG